MSHPSPLTALKIPLNKCGSFLRKLANHLHTESNLPSIIPDETGVKTSRLLLLNKTIHTKDLTGLPEELKTWIKDQKDVSVIDYFPEEVSKKLRRNKTLMIETEALEEVLPKEIDSNIRKETLKHIIIMNLEKEQTPYKMCIAKLLLEVHLQKKTAFSYKNHVFHMKSLINTIFSFKFHVFSHFSFKFHLFSEVKAR